jgi:hypothetical protein
MVLLREFYLDNGEITYTGRDSVCPVENITSVHRWADTKIPNWQNLELFDIKSQLVALTPARKA